MARTKQADVSKAASLQGDEISRFRMGEIGHVGLPIFNGVSKEEIKKELNHPNSVKTYKLMSYHPSVNAPLNLYSNMVGKASYRFLPPKDATEEEKNQAEIVESMFSDMDHSISDFVEEAMTMTTYGFSVVEKVYRKRTTSAGSMYNDGYVGIKKLSLRSQESIEKFIFDDNGNEVLAVKQNLAGLNDPYQQFIKRKDTDVTIPRSKFMLFNLGRNRSNPYGTSPLRDVFVNWKYLQAIEELEAQSIVKDINGLPVLRIPAQYMSADAGAEQKLIYASFQNIMKNLQQGSQSSMILPSTVDPESRSQLFQIELLSQDGKKNFDLNKVKEYYRAMIFIGMGADVLLMGNTSVGSFALGSLKTSLTGSVAEMYIKRILQVINDDLIKQVYELNGWNPARRCKMDYEGFEDSDLETFSKAVQRVGATGYLPKTLDVINSVMKSLNIDPLPEDTTQDELDELLPEKTTRSGDGQESGLPGGTGDATGSSGNSSDTNSDNKA